MKGLIPVILLPGRLRLATKPSLTGSPPVMKTIGIVEVADFAARAENGATTGGNHRDLLADEIGC